MSFFLICARQDNMVPIFDTLFKCRHFDVRGFFGEFNFMDPGIYIEFHIYNIYVRIKYTYIYDNLYLYKTLL